MNVVFKARDKSLYSDSREKPLRVAIDITASVILASSENVDRQIQKAYSTLLPTKAFRYHKSDV
jgi:hypothetical protein